MKRIFIILALLMAVAVIGFYLTDKTRRKRSVVPDSLATASAAHPQTSIQLLNTNVRNVANRTTNSNAASTPASFAVPSTSSQNPLEATNLTQWKSIIKNLQLSSKFSDMETWVMEETNREMGIPVLLGHNGERVPYKVRFIDVRAGLPNENIQRIEMHSPIMNIDETQELGLKLCDLLGIDSKEFTNWCDKVGNHWLDAPLYSSKSGYHLGFETLMTYNDERPWFINFIIVNREK